MAILDGKLTEHQLAQELGYNIRTIRLWRAARKGPPYFQLGRRIMYRRAAVERWLQSLEQEQPRAGRSA